MSLKFLILDIVDLVLNNVPEMLINTNCFLDIFLKYISQY